MYHTLLAALLVLAACSDPVRPTCPINDTRAWCERQCVAGSDAVCAPGAEDTCLAECLRCEPDVGWCPH